MVAEQKPWFAEYKVHGIPKTLQPYPQAPSHQFLVQAAAKHPKMGYVQLGYEMSYPEAVDKAARLASSLHDLGIRKGDRVATLLPTSIQFVLADHAISMAGAVHVPFSYLEPPDHLEYKFKESTPKAVVIIHEHLDVISALMRRYPVPNVIVAKINDYSSAPPALPALSGMHWLTKLIDTHRPELPEVSCDPENDLETLLFTGGTTGIPKGCMLTHRNIIANSIQNSYAMGIVTQILVGNISVLIGLPFFHSYGHCIMHTMTHLGFKQLLVPDARDVKSMVSMIKEHYPILQIGVPTQFMKMLDEELKGIGILGLSGSAPLPPEVQEKFESKGAGVIMEGYGLSEMSPVTHINASAMVRIFGGHLPVRLNSMLLRLPGNIPFLRALLSLLGYHFIGRLMSFLVPRLTKLSRLMPVLRKTEKRATIGIPLPDTDIKILSTEGDRELTLEETTREGKTGELLLRGPQRMLGYWPEPGTGFDKDGFIHTGDVVRIDPKGYFFIEDRIKDMIVVSGFKVYSREVDDILYNHPAVAMAATLGVPDPERPGSELVKVFIQPKPELKGKVTSEEVIAYLRERVAKYAVPKLVEFIDEMPLTEVFKIDKKRLREIEKRKIEARRAEDRRAASPTPTAPLI